MNSVTAVEPVPKSDHADLEGLRKILLGKEYQELLALKDQLNNPGQHSVKVAAIVSEALEIRAKQDNSFNTFANLRKWQFFHFFRSVTH